VPIAGKLGLGSVVGYLAGGCLIGPHVIGLVNEADTVKALADFGVVFMLFAIGLQMDLHKLWSMRRDVFLGGSLQLGLASLGLGLLFLALGLPPAAALIGSLAVGLSSTAVAMQSMVERNLDKAPVGRSAFTILLFEDVFSIPLVAVVPLFGAAAAESQGALGVLQGLGAIVGVVAIGRYFTRPVLTAIASTGQREVFTAFTLLLVVGIGGLMAMAGLSMALGAFLAGVLLASSEYRHALETDILPFKGLLMGLFFITVGMTADLSLFVSEPLKVLGLAAIALTIKILALRFTARVMGVAQGQRWLFAFLISQGGEFAFVVLGVAGMAGVIPDDWGKAMVLSVALSMALTPFLLIAYERLARTTKPVGEADTIDEDNPVLIAGFGRVGQIIGRFLFASGIKATVLDHDPDQIEVLKRFGFKIFYGDATRLDLLDAAGAGRAKVLVVAIDDVESSVSLVEKVRAQFPKLRIIARARNVGHYTQLRRLGVEVVERETFESSIKLGREALMALGCPPYEARERADRFRKNNVGMLESLLPIWEDEAKRRQLAIQSRKELEEQFELERQALASRGIAGWHYEHDAPEESARDLGAS
ncbi:MAG TPA: cation:proton antiporter, partial [Myxococcota bacterium]|nr:cation:proton antiporter [Myxococcota bacterium]